MAWLSNPENGWQEVWSSIFRTNEFFKKSTEKELVLIIGGVDAYHGWENRQGNLVMFFGHKTQPTEENDWGIARRNRNLTLDKGLKEAYINSLSQNAHFNHKTLTITIPEKHLLINTQAMFVSSTRGVLIDIDPQFLFNKSYKGHESLETYEEMAFMFHDDPEQNIILEKSAFYTDVEPRGKIIMVMHLPEGFAYDRVMSFSYAKNSDEDQLFVPQE